jgi:hypothetical protein
MRIILETPPRKQNASSLGAILDDGGQDDAKDGKVQAKGKR